MSHIRAKDTKLERDFLKILSAQSHVAGFRYRKNYTGIRGKPDIAFPAAKIAIFVDGCFWHGCAQHSRTPLSNTSYWKKKLERNKVRDKEINKMNKKEGWRVIRFWEHQIKKNPTKAVEKIMKELER